MAGRIKLILNPMADTGHAWAVANDLRSIVQRHGNAEWSGTVYPTHATELAHQAAEKGYERVIALGGDGTVHEVVNGLMQVPPERRPILGVVPIGSGNDFAHAIGAPTNPAEALQAALYASPQPVDIAHVTSPDGAIDEYFDNTLGIGFDAIVTIRSRQLTRLRGFSMYLAAVLQTILLNHRGIHYRIETDHSLLTIDGLMVVACNGGREGGGFLLSPQFHITDGKFDLIAMEKVSRLMMLRLLPEFIRGTHLAFQATHFIRTQKLSITADAPLYIHADGEILAGFGSDIRALTFQMLPGALQVARP
jgi:YegS/Rv2252/BmrU family lipid kinase